ncbi:MAG: hypothetical protein R3321_06860 [Nitrososphaeraceae archaeon]|nr:hypothetical protein [Nitrososphaeraceae archaeon]
MKVRKNEISLGVQMLIINLTLKNISKFEIISHVCDLLEIPYLEAVRIVDSVIQISTYETYRN